MTILSKILMVILLYGQFIHLTRIHLRCMRILPCNKDIQVMNQNKRIGLVAGNTIVIWGHVRYLRIRMFSLTVNVFVLNN